MRSLIDVYIASESTMGLLMLATPRSFLPDPVLIALMVAVLALAVAIALLLKQRGKTVKKASSSRSSVTTSPPKVKPPPPPPKRPMPATTRPTVRKRNRRILPPREEATLAEDVGDYSRAAAVWMQRGNRVAQHRALKMAGDEAGLAQLELALGWPELAVPRLEGLLERKPDNIDLRLKLFFAYLDLKEWDKAQSLAYRILDSPEETHVSAGHLARFAMGFEASGARDAALRFYDEASKRPDAPEDVEIRVLYLEELNRLQDPPETTSGEFAASGVISMAFDRSTGRKAAESPSPEELLDQELDKAAGEEPKEFVKPPKSDRLGVPHLSGHEIIVGHLALGGEAAKNGFPTHSIASLSARYKLRRLAGEARHTALFEAMDRLLDCPVAIKLCHIAMSEQDFNVLRDRLRIVASLNHPNLTKTTFVDRTENVVRIVTEFHSGGNLEVLLTRMEKVGLPLMLRLMMQVTSGIHAAHSHGVVHGDLRPRNIMIGHDQLIKVVDFDLAPWPVRRLKPDDSRGREVLQMFPPEEIQIDIKRFAALLEHVLERTVVSSVLAGNFEEGDPLEELREVAKRAREGAFSSLTPIQRIFEQIMESIQPMGRAE